jgi:hypothetical protein
VHDHFDEGHSRYANVFEVLWIGAPWIRLLDLLLLLGIECVEGVAVSVSELDGVLDL